MAETRSPGTPNVRSSPSPSHSVGKAAERGDQNTTLSSGSRPSITFRNDGSHETFRTRERKEPCRSFPACDIHSRISERRVPHTAQDSSRLRVEQWLRTNLKDKSKSKAARGPKQMLSKVFLAIISFMLGKFNYSRDESGLLTPEWRMSLPLYSHVRDGFN